jgi:hypothetical protein
VQAFTAPAAYRGKSSASKTASVTTFEGARGGRPALTALPLRYAK